MKKIFCCSPDVDLTLKTVISNLKLSVLLLILLLHLYIYCRRKIRLFKFNHQLSEWNHRPWNEIRAKKKKKETKFPSSSSCCASSPSLMMNIESLQVAVNEENMRPCLQLSNWWINPNQRIPSSWTPSSTQLLVTPFNCFYRQLFIYITVGLKL